MSRTRLAIVVPTLHEAGYLPSLLADLDRLETPHRVVVVDGGSTDGTPELAHRMGAEVIRAARGRGTQLAAGARVLDARWLLFLHADVRVPGAARDALEAWVEADGGGHDAAVFRFRLDGDRWTWRLLELGQRARERLSGLAYGDQGLLVRRSAFEAVGGFPDLPIMEDVEMVRRLRRRFGVARLPAALISSPRRYEREGPLRAWLRNTALISLHLAGVPPRTLARWYRPEPAEESDGVRTPPRGGAAPPPMLLVFAKAPVPGRVKTRLARSVGPDRAARLYRRVGRGVVDRVRQGPWRTVVFYDPPGSEATLRSWLGSREIDFRPQEGRQLGERMAAAFRWAFERAERVCIVGTDAPGVDLATVRTAFRALDDVDVVLGPAADGGYYLMALDRPRDHLFRDIPWSTEDVLHRTLSAAGARGLRVRLLDEAVDLDTADDLSRLSGLLPPNIHQHLGEAEPGG